LKGGIQTNKRKFNNHCRRRQYWHLHQLENKESKGQGSNLKHRFVQLSTEFKLKIFGSMAAGLILRAASIRF
jgi:hypothetical protein